MKPQRKQLLWWLGALALGTGPWLIRRLTTSANTSRFIVTSDHGFIYKREKLTDGDKIGGISKASQRYAIAATPETDGGIAEMPVPADRPGEPPCGNGFLGRGRERRRGHLL